MSEKKVCVIPGCTRERRARGWCPMHWMRWRRNGDPLVTVKPGGSVKERLLRQILLGVEGGCPWQWAGATDPSGYGAFGRSQPRRKVNAHRVAYELYVGPIPAGLELDHLCGRGAQGCVTPTHMEPVTKTENLVRAAARRKQARIAREALKEEKG